MKDADSDNPAPWHRRVIRRLFPSRTVGAWYIVFGLVGAGICFVPLFDRIGYESAALFGGLAGAVVPFLTLHAFEAGEFGRPTGESAADIVDFGWLVVRHLGLLVVPAILLTLNALRVRNCDFETGFAFWLVIPVVTVFLAQTLGWCASSWQSASRWQRNSCVAVFIVAAAVWFGWRLATQPPITGHQWMIGYFSGSIYDEALSLPWSLVYYRALNLSVAFTSLAMIGVARDWQSAKHTRSRDRVAEAVGWSAVLAFVFLSTAVTLWQYGPDQGVGITRSYIVDELGGRIETDHFIIHHPQTERFLDRRDALAEDHEFRYREMRAFFETNPGDDQKIHSFVYANRDQKARLMGGRRTQVARVWLSEMHLLWPRYGDHMLAHELAHVFTRPFGSGPLRLSANGWFGINMGLVEGIATAADWPVDEMTPHQAAAALNRSGLAPDLRDIVGAGGFWTTASRRAYTLTGSFLRYLRDEYGIDKVKDAYRRGDFQSAFDTSSEELIGEWEGFLSEVSLDSGTMELVRYLYRRPSIFSKVCPRTIGELKRRARHAAASGDIHRASRIYDRITGFAPKNVDFQVEYAELLLRGGAVEEAITKLKNLRDEHELAAVHRAEVWELLGDGRWRKDDLRGARRAYESCLERRLPAGKERLNQVKLASLAPERERVHRLAFEYLVEGAADGIASYFPMEWFRRRPTDALSAYLVGRRLWAARHWSDAARYLDMATEDDLPAILRLEARRLLARSLYFSDEAGHSQRARVEFKKLVDAPRARYRSEAKEWLERVGDVRD